MTESVKAILAQATTIAIIGAVDKPGRPVDRVARYLMDNGYTVVPVHKKRKTAWGLNAYPDMEHIPADLGPINVVNVFQPSQLCLEQALITLRLRPLPALFWLQEGIHNAQARALFTETTVTYVENACLMREHKRLEK